MDLSWADFFSRLRALDIDRPDNIVYGIPNGGMIAAGFLERATVTAHAGEATVILDDILDSGRTALAYRERFPRAFFAFVVDKKKEGLEQTWVRMPWEVDHPGGAVSVEENVVRILQFIGEDPDRPGLVETPRRVVKAFQELCSGYAIDATDLLKVFPDPCDEMVIVRNITFHSLCEHHLLQFSGRATVGYLPRGKIVGLSKIPRLVHAFSRRLQVQERLTSEIATALMGHRVLDPLGVGVILRAKHSCASIRGIKEPDTEMVTSSLLGNFRSDPLVRAEFLRLANGGGE